MTYNTPKIEVSVRTQKYEVTRAFLKIFAGLNDSFTNQAYVAGVLQSNVYISVQRLEDDEVIAVLAHEIGHWKYHHSVKLIYFFIVRKHLEKFKKPVFGERET